MTTSVVMTPGGFGNQTSVVNGNTYTSINGGTVNALPADVAGLQAQGWQSVPNYLAESVSGQAATGTSTQLTGFTYTVPNGQQLVLFTPAGTIATGTVTLPANPADGQEVTLATTQTITALTVNANTGQTLQGTAPTTLTVALVALKFKFCAAQAAWVRVQ